MAAACGVVAFVCLILPAAMRDNAAAALRTTVVAPLAALQEKAELSRRAFLAHDDAVRVADSVTLRSQRLHGVEQENARLRSLLGLGSALQWGFVPAEALRGRGLGDEYTVTLSAGKNAGVTPLSPVVAAEGIVGMVERVDEQLSLAILWPHPDFRVSAMSADGAASGVVAAHHGTADARDYLEFRGAPLRPQLKAGMPIVSSGHGGVYPRGIPVGTVIAELKNPDGYVRNYLLRPAVKLSEVASVMVLTADRTKAGIGNVWQVTVPVDSAQKGVVAAGDSVRRVAGDSVRRTAVDTVRRTAADSAKKGRP
jgi:rod shape-determining protein MreC